jgi:riboflavin synthase alpha subunit
VFTGIIPGLGRVAAFRRVGAGARLVVDGGPLLRDLEAGESIAINGVCLTVVTEGGPDAANPWSLGATRGRTLPSAEGRPGRAAFDLVAETLNRSKLGALGPGDVVNLERSLHYGDRVGGHLVSGHVDGTGVISAIRRVGPGGSGGREVTIALPPALQGKLQEKGSVAVDGISLTVAALVPGGFRVALIPETLRRTTLGRARKGERANIEVDHGPSPHAASWVTWDLLRQYGYLR